MIPIDESFLYVMPVYVQAKRRRADPRTEASGCGERLSDVSVADNLPDALELATSGALGGGPSGGGNGAPTGSIDQQIQQALTQAVQHFANAEAALRTGDLATYQSELKAAQDLVQQANDLQTGGERFGTPIPVPSPSPSPERPAAGTGIGVELGGVRLGFLQTSGVVPVHRLPARELVEHPHAGLTRAVAALGVPAERQVRFRAARRVVHADHPGRDQLAEPQGGQRVVV